MNRLANPKYTNKAIISLTVVISGPEAIAGSIFILSIIIGIIAPKIPVKIRAIDSDIAITSDVQKTLTSEENPNKLINKLQIPKLIIPSTKLLISITKNSRPIYFNIFLLPLIHFFQVV